MSKNRLTDSQAREIAAREIAKGTPVTSLQQKTTRAPKTIQKWLDTDDSFKKLVEKYRIEATKDNTEQILTALARGDSPSEVAFKLEVPESTIYSYLSDPSFAHSVKQKQDQYYEDARRKLKASVPKAVQLLTSACEGKSSVSTAQINAAKEVLLFNKISPEDYYSISTTTVTTYEDVVEKLKGLNRAILLEALKAQEEQNE